MSRTWNRFVLGATVALCKGLSLWGALGPLEKRDWKRILLVQNTALGDTLLSTPAVRAVRQSFPRAHIALIGHIRYASLLRLNPHLDELLVYRGKAKSFWPLAKRIKAGRFEVGLVLHGNDPETIPLLWAGGIKQIVADANTRHGYLLSRMLSELDANEHIIDHRLALAQAIGASVSGRWMEQPVPQTLLDSAEAVIQDRLPGSGPLIAIAPGGSAAYKRWPIGRFALAAHWLQEKYNARILILTSGSEKHLGDRISRSLAGPNWATNGQVNLPQVAALLAKCRLLLANDSGLFHLAQAIKTPVLCLMGAEGPANYGPLEAKRAEYIFIRSEVCPLNNCLRKDCPYPACLDLIPTEAVLARLEDNFADLLVG